MLASLKKLWKAVKALPWVRSDAGEVWRHGYGGRYQGASYGARRQRHQSIRGPKNGYGTRPGPGF